MLSFCPIWYGMGEGFRLPSVSETVGSECHAGHKRFGMGDLAPCCSGPPGEMAFPFHLLYLSIA